MKRQLICVAVLGLLGLYTSSSQAFFIATEPTHLKAGVPTDVYVAGFGNDQGSQFLETAILGAKVSRDHFPDHQRVIISAVTEDLDHEGSLLKNAGLSLRKDDKDELNKDVLLSTLQGLSVPVRSLQFYGHANTYNGLRLQSKYKRLNYTDDQFASIGSVLDKQAIVVFNSCNSGWLLAPAAAKLWHRPVFGSLTGDNFQEFMSDHQWYFNDPGLFPSNTTRMQSTADITSETVSCHSSACLRMKPVNASYHDEFGTFQRGLGFYKVFASEKAKSLVPAALLHFTLLYPSDRPITVNSSRDEWVSAISEWMCPNDESGSSRKACYAAIAAKEFMTKPTLSFFHGTAIACDNISCQTIVKCHALKYIFGQIPCETEDLSNAVSTVFSDQLKQAFSGLDALENGDIGKDF